MSKRSTSPFVHASMVEDDSAHDAGLGMGETAQYPNPELEALRSLLRQVEAERDKAIAQVALLSSKGSPQMVLRSDGSRAISLILDPDKVALYSAWAQDYGVTFEEMAQRQIIEALDAYAG